MSPMSISGPPRRSSPWLKIVLMLLALGMVIYLIAHLGDASTESLLQLTPDSEEETPEANADSPADQDRITPPPPIDEPDDPSVTPPPMPDELESRGEMEKMLLDRIRSTVTHVYDGDTIMLADGTRIRYIAVDTPERGQPYYNEALSFNKSMVEMKSVQYEVCKKRPQDKHGRTLASVQVEGRSLEEALLSFGLAEPFHDRDCVPDCRTQWKLLLEAFVKKRGMFENAQTEPVPAVVADRLLGQYGKVVGVVDNFHESSSVYHLNFGSDWTTDFSATIAKADLEQFLRDKLDPRQLVGMKVTLFGKVISSYGPRIFLNCPAQVIAVAAP